MLLEAGLTLASELSLPIVLQRIVNLAARLTDARYGALGVLGEDGTLVQFVTTGLSPAQRRAIGKLPTGRGVLGVLIHDPKPVRISNIADHSKSVGFPANHPPMRSFLGAPVQAMGRVFGNIYLAEKKGAAEFGREDEDSLVVLATQAGTAIANATLYDELRSRERWLEALRDITAQVLNGADEQGLLDGIAEHARQIASADAATVVTIGDQPGRLVVAAAVGARSSQILGQTLPSSGSISGNVMSTGHSLVLADVSSEAGAFQPVAQLGRHGPAVFSPLRVAGGATGTLMVTRLKGGSPFDPRQVRLIESFADQASVAIEYGRAQAELRRLGLLEERERIAKELHDGIIQSLFAVGMGLQATALMAGSPALTTRIEGAVEELDKSIRDLRNYIFGLRPGILADRQLDQALRSLGDEAQSRTSTQVDVEIDADLAASLAGRSAEIVQLTREALSNITRHSQARHAAVRLSRRGSRAVLTIKDDGMGFDRTRATKGFGLGNMRARAVAIGGKLQLESGEGRGTTLRVSFPA